MHLILPPSLQSQLEKINDEKLITAVADDIDDLDDDDGDEIPQLLHEVNESRRMSMARRFSTKTRRSSFTEFVSANIDAPLRSIGRQQCGRDALRQEGIE